MEKQFRPLDTQIRSLDEKRRTITFAASTEAVDRMGDVLRVKGWKLDNYRKNGVFLWSHRSSDPPIGKTVEIHIEQNPPALVQTVEFATKAVYPWAETVWQLYKGGFLKAVSVGFLPLTEPKPRVDDKSGAFLGYEFENQELLELSAVSVPANPEALGRAVQKGLLTASQAKEFRAASLTIPQAFLDALDKEEKECSTIFTIADLERALRS